MLLARAAALLAASTLILLAGCGVAPRLRTAPDAAAAVFAAGEIRALDHHGFSPAAAQNGLWRPHAALESGGAGIYFLEPYDPKRIPVLFVHGISGSPRDFQPILDSLDRSRFQAWVLHYPTGLRLHTASRALLGILAELQRKHRFDTLFIAAHSMGGLVSRGYLVESLRDGTGGYARLLVTFSSPWEGHAWAQAGARYMPGPPGSWIDLSPESDFLVSLRESLGRVPHYVFFGFRRGPSLLTSESSDGTIAMTSQLPGWLQEQAERCWGYDADHVGILSHPAALGRFNSLLAYEADRLGSNRMPAANSR
jgi:pimeloyl-ACP methyl ester carboxylesterase